MPTLFMRLAGPMQSWGTSSRFDHRDTGKEPSKSGVIGLLAAGLGIDRSLWNEDLQALSALRMGVRHDRPGELMTDYQTAQHIISADRSKQHETSVSTRDYLADAVFLVGLEGDNHDLLKRAHLALQNPVWPLSLGRRSYVPSEPIWLEGGVQSVDLLGGITAQPWLAISRANDVRPARLLVSIETQSTEGALRMDQPLSAFAERRFGARYVLSQWMDLKPEVVDAAV